MIKEFWEEQKEERKQKKLLKKQHKKQLTKLEQSRKIFGIITIVLIIFGAFATTCSGASSSGVNWQDAIGLTEEYIIEMEKPVDENILFPNGKVMEEDWQSFTQVLISGGMNIFDAEGKVNDDLLPGAKLNFPVDITSKHLGAICKEMNASMGAGDITNICYFEIYKENDKYYEKSIVYLDLEKVIADIDLPAVYLTTVSEVKILAGQLTAMSYDVVINQLGKELSDEILHELNEISNDRITRIANSTINNYIYLFFDSINLNYSLIDGGLQLSSDTLI